MIYYGDAVHIGGFFGGMGTNVEILTSMFI